MALERSTQKKSCGSRPKRDRNCIEGDLKSSSEIRANFGHFVLKEYFHWDHHNYLYVIVDIGIYLD